MKVIFVKMPSRKGIPDMRERERESRYLGFCMSYHREALKESVGPDGIGPT